MNETRRKNDDPPKKNTVGFLAISDTEHSGVIGGYLIVNGLGQPVEFHCTVPMQANRAQQILYGATLKPYLYGEQVAATLMEKARTRPGLVYVQAAATAPARGIVGLPMVRVAVEQGTDAHPMSPALSVLSDEGSALTSSGWEAIDLQNVTAWVLSDYAEDAEVARQSLSQHSQHFHVHEPFERIYLAIGEAAKGYANSVDRQAAG